MAARLRAPEAAEIQAVHRVAKVAPGVSAARDKAEAAGRLVCLAARTRAAMRRGNACVIRVLPGTGNCASISTNARNKPTIVTIRRRARIRRVHLRALVLLEPLAIHSRDVKNVGSKSRRPPITRVFDVSTTPFSVLVTAAAAVWAMARVITRPNPFARGRRPIGKRSPQDRRIVAESRIRAIFGAGGRMDSGNWGSAIRLRKRSRCTPAWSANSRA